MNGSVNFDGTLSGSISTGGGGGGGSTVVITPVVTEGTKIADVTVDGAEKDLYCPTITPTEVSVTQVQASGTKIASIDVDGQSVDLYAPTPSTPTEVTVTQVQASGTKIASIGVNGVDTDIYAPAASGVVYSTTEQVIGTWIDGKPLYQKTFDCGALPNAQTKEVSFTEDMETATIINAFAMSTSMGYVISLPDVVPDYIAGSVRIYVSKTAKKIYIYSQADVSTYDKSYVTIQYTKTTDS